MPKNEEIVVHIGTKFHSGRYPWGSGGNITDSTAFLKTVSKLRTSGMSELQVSKALGMSTKVLREQRGLAKAKQKQDLQNQAFRLREKGMSKTAVAKRMGLNESSVRNLLKPSENSKADINTRVVGVLKKAVADKKYIDIGKGVEGHLGITKIQFKNAVRAMENAGYTKHYAKVRQIATGKDTSIVFMAAPGVSNKEASANRGNVQLVLNPSKDHGRTFKSLDSVAPRNVPTKDVAIVYAKDGGADRDGIIELREGVPELSLGRAQYAQVRIAIGGSHFAKGMAILSDKLPAGVNVRIYSKKEDSGDKLDALKPQLDDVGNPFGSSVNKKEFVNVKGETELSAVNSVYEEGEWGDWSRSLSSQFLAKQSVALAKRQLDLAFDRKMDEYEDIMAVTNPVVKKHLLKGFANAVDSSTIHLKAAALPRQATQVLIPVVSMGDNEIYAPQFDNGESVVLIRHPHGGKFEIPRLTVNNKNPEAKSFMKNARDAVGINPKVASKLSGADFDGDTVLVIPNNSKAVKHAASLDGLKDFDPITAYPGYPGMKTMTSKSKGVQMGKASNLITDMTIKGANADEIARAVRHSMVVIDAEKHGLDYRASAIQNGISELKKTYQGKTTGGASTLLSRSNAQQRVDERTDYYSIDKDGSKVYKKTGKSYTDVKGRIVVKQTKSKQMLETSDARTLSSGTVIEAVYANYANKLKALGNKTRLSREKVEVKPYSRTAFKTYRPEVDSLVAKLKLAVMNSPLERQAQILANATLAAKKLSNPHLKDDAARFKKEKFRALRMARDQVGAKKPQIVITPREWEAIQMGAITTTRLTDILDNADMDQIKKLATPKASTTLGTAKTTRALALIDAGYTAAETARAIGVPVSQINSIDKTG